jgi:hypothetical protein
MKSSKKWAAFTGIAIASTASNPVRAVAKAIWLQLPDSRSETSVLRCKKKSTLTLKQKMAGIHTGIQSKTAHQLHFAANALQPAPLPRTYISDSFHKAGQAPVSSSCYGTNAYRGVSATFRSFIFVLHPVAARKATARPSQNFLPDAFCYRLQMKQTCECSVCGLLCMALDLVSRCLRRLQSIVTLFACRQIGHFGLDYHL